MEHDVIIVGSGPVGLLLACELRLAGVRTLVLDQLLEPAGQDRAGVLHTRSVECLAIRGLLETFEQGMGVSRGLPFAGIFTHGLDHALVDSRHQFSLLVPQSRTERLLHARAVELGADIRRGHRVRGLSRREDSATVTVTAPDGSYEATAPYVVGCDGGRSTVRRLAGIDFPGVDAKVAALIGYVSLPVENVPRRWMRTPRGIVVLNFPPEGGIGRVVIVEYDREAPAREEPVTLPELRSAVARVYGEELPLQEPVQWMSRFSDMTRQAAQYRSGRVLLAGDAAHIHFPIGGQGLSCGLQDALNLGWKLGAVVRGEAPESLLDTYHDERRPVAVRIGMNTRAQLALMNPDQQHIDALRTLFEELLLVPEANRHLTEMINALDTRYEMDDGGDPTWAGRFVPDLDLKTSEGTTRVSTLLHDGRPVLLDLAGRTDLTGVAAPWRDRVPIVHATTDRPAPDVVLVRPDGYVAWADDGGKEAPAGLRASLARWFGPPSGT
ncbi:FAD-dependent monooxygenase [Micromonospora sp. PTRAS2]